MPSLPSVRARLQADLTLALRERDAVRVSVLRTTLAAIANAEAVDVADHGTGQGAFATEVDRRVLSEADVCAIVAAERDDLQASSDEFASLGQPAEAERLAAQALLLEQYLA